MPEGHVYDALIVGSGATGGWAAMELTEGGLDVLLLEAGARIRPEKYIDQPSQLVPDVFADPRKHPYSFPSNKPFRWNRHRVFGGRTLAWNRVSLRFSDHDFFAARFDGHGENWPISYSDLAPFYDRVETFWGVSGARDGLAHLPDGVFLPPTAMTNAETEVRRVVDRQWNDRCVIHQRGVLSNRATRDDWGFQTSVGSSLAAAERTGRLTTRLNAVVSHLIMRSDGRRARGVVGVDTATNASFEEFARVVVLCASSFESVRILLNSIAEEKVAAIEDSSAALGHYLMDHTTIKFSGAMEQFSGQPCDSNAGGPYGFYIPRFRNIASRHPNYLRGFGVMGSAQRQQRQFVQVDDEVVEAPAAPAVDVALGLIGYGETLPAYENSLSLDPNTRDTDGIPSLRINFRYGSNEIAMAQDLVNFFAELLAALKVTIPGNQLVLLPPGSSIHECGGARMGNDPRTSVLNRHNQLWNVPNVFLTDGSCFVTSPCQNPTLTMVAITSRTCRFILDELGKGDL